jgi:hypothetical protein
MILKQGNGNVGGREVVKAGRFWRLRGGLWVQVRRACWLMIEMCWKSDRRLCLILMECDVI